MKRESRIKFYKNLSKKVAADGSLFSFYAQGPEKNFNNKQDNKSKNDSVSLDYKLVDQNNAMSQYVQEGDFLVATFTIVMYKGEGGISEYVFKHYFKKENESESYLELIKARDDYFGQVGSKFPFGSEIYTKIYLKEGSGWHRNLISKFKSPTPAVQRNAFEPKKEVVKKEVEEKKKRYGVQRGSQNVSAEYLDALEQEWKEGDIGSSEEDIEDWVDNLSESELNNLKKAIEDMEGIGLSDFQEKVKEKVEEKTEEKPEVGSSEEKTLSDLPKKGDAVESSVVAKLHPNFDLIPDGLNNYRGGALYSSDPMSQFKILRDKYGIKRIIKLNGDEKLSAEQERKISEELGLEFYKINAHNPSSSGGKYESGIGYTNTVKETSEILAKGNTYVHCTGGMDRTGFVVAAWLKSKRGISNDDIQGLESLYSYTIQYNAWESGGLICNAKNTGYARYLDSFYPVRKWCEAKEKRKGCALCKDINKHFPVGLHPKVKK